jgi:hypothetical protein
MPAKRGVPLQSLPVRVAGIVAADRVPIVSGALILAVAVAVSHFLMSTVTYEQELSVRRLAAVYLDGISTTVYPHVVARNLTNTIEALHRTMWFHESMREQRAMVRLPDGSLFADVSAQQEDANAEDRIHAAALDRRIQRGDGFVFDENAGTGWAMRAIVREGKHVADLYVGLELKPLIEERNTLRRNLLMATVSASLGAAAIGYMIVYRMVQPLRLLTERLRRAQAGDFKRVSATMLPPASSEYGRLLRGYNDLVDALGEREAMALRLAQRERESMLGRLAATVAHEVRNPLAGFVFHRTRRSPTSSTAAYPRDPGTPPISVCSMSISIPARYPTVRCMLMDSRRH